jgi:hypothetical protein
VITQIEILKSKSISNIQTSSSKYIYMVSCYLNSQCPVNVLISALYGNIQKVQSVVGVRELVHHGSFGVVEVESFKNNLAFLERGVKSCLANHWENCSDDEVNIYIYTPSSH